MNSIPELEPSRILERPKKRKKKISKSKLRGLLGFHVEHHPPFLVGTSAHDYVGLRKTYPFRKSVSSPTLEASKVAGTNAMNHMTQKEYPLPYYGCPNLKVFESYEPKLGKKNEHRIRHLFRFGDASRMFTVEAVRLITVN